MAISSVNLSSALGAYANQAQAGDAQKNPDTQRNPLATLQRKEASALTQFSAFGQVKASLADVQAKAQALKNLNNPPTLSDFKLAVQGFVQSFNALNKTVNEATTSTPGKQGLLSADSRPGQALNDVRKAVAGPGESSLSALQKLGIERQKEGGFSINQKQLEKAFQDKPADTLSTLVEVSDRVEKAIDKQLSSSGGIGRKVNDLSERASELESTRNAAQARLDTQKSYQQRLASQLAAATSYVARNAVATYFSVSTL